MLSGIAVVTRSYLGMGVDVPEQARKADVGGIMMGDQDRYRGQDPDDLYSTREEDAYASGDEPTSSARPAGARSADEPSMRQEQGGQGYGPGPRGYQDEPGFAGGDQGLDEDDYYSSDMGGMHDEGIASHRPRPQDDEDELYGNQLDDMHDRDDETGENW
ncbi:hypothetical protein GCM10009527_073950 [Actinomadura nitritigenes]